MNSRTRCAAFAVDSMSPNGTRKRMASADADRPGG
jgi:hypothetical protein